MQKKDDKMGKKTANKEGKKKKREREFEIDSPKKVQILVFAHAWITKKLFNFVRFVGKYVFFSFKTRF